MSKTDAAQSNPAIEDIEWLRQAWKEAEGDPGSYLTEEEMDVVFDRLEAKYRKLADEKAARTDAA